MKNVIITKLEEMLQQPEASAVAHQMRTLQKEYQKLWTAEFETAKQQFVDEGGKAKEFEYAKSPEDVKICRSATICSAAPALPDFNIAAQDIFV